MRYPILIKEVGHFCRNHVSVVGHRDKGNFLAGLGCRIGTRGRCLRDTGLLCVAHNTISIHETMVKRGYSNASKEERSGNCVWHAVQVTK